MADSVWDWMPPEWRTIAGASCRVEEGWIVAARREYGPGEILIVGPGLPGVDLDEEGMASQTWRWKAEEGWLGLD